MTKIELGHDVNEILEVLNQFRRLDLFYYQFETKYFIKLTEALKFNQTLNDLCLEQNLLGLDLNKIVALTDALKINQSLKGLDLDNNYINHKGFVLLLEIFKFNQTLINLSLNFNQIGWQEIHLLNGYLEINRRLNRQKINQKKLNKIRSNSSNELYYIMVLSIPIHLLNTLI